MLSVRNLTKIYKTKGGEPVKALNNVTLDFPETGMVFLLGKSGSGKSTLLNLIGGLDSPTSGEVILKGRSSKNFNQSDFDSYRNTYIGFIFQEYNILNEFNVEHNIGLAMELQHKKVKKSDINSLLEQVDLKDYAKRKPNTLSGGQKQRIAIARALIKNPKIILADEPTGALDSKTGAQVFDTLKKLSQDKLIIVVSHDRDFAETYADRIIELKDGQVLTDETKFKKEATKVTENVSIINENSIKINDAKSLTREEFIKLYDKIKQSDGEVFISSGENAQKSMKVNRISSNGYSEDFKKTEKIEVKQYNPKETKFIRSKMPLNKSVKMGLSSLKTKPIRLLFTIFLAVVSFAMFGVVSSLMLYKSTYTYAEALKNVDYQSELLVKRADYTNINRQYKNGELQYENSYTQDKQVMFGESEIEEFNNNNLNMYAIGLNETNVYFNQTITTHKEYYSFLKIKYLTDCGVEKLDNLNFTIIGDYPTSKNEIALPYEYYNMMKDNDETINSTSDAIGKTVSYNSNTLTISGFVNTGEIPSKYSQLKNSESTLSVKDKTELLENFSEYISCSFNCVGFITKELQNEIYKQNKNSYSIYISSKYRKGIGVSLQDIKDETIEETTGSNFYYFDTYLNNKSLFKVYAFDGSKITDVQLNDNEVIISANSFCEILANSVIYMNGIFNNVYNLRFSPNFKTYCDNHNNEIHSALNYISNASWNYNASVDIVRENISYLIGIINTYKDEYNKEQLVNNCGNIITNTEYFDNLSNEDKSKVFNVINYGYGGTQQDFEFTYNLLLNHFDIECPNYFLLEYFKNLRDYDGNGSEEVRRAIDNNNDLNSIDLSQSYLELTQIQIDSIKNLIDNYFYLLDTKQIYGYSFNEMDYTKYCIKELSTKLYYKNYLNYFGSFNIIGYYESSNKSEIPIINKNAIVALSKAEESEYETVYKSNYETPEDERYAFIMTKTTYSIEEIGFITKKQNEYQYYLTNNIYQQTSMIASLIEQLKTIFFWVGVVLGAFSALMLLNFITVSISYKKRDIGVLRAIGARKGDVFKIFFSESLFIGMICFVLASIATYIIELFLNKSFIDKIGISVLEFGPINIGLIFGIALIITFISTIFPVMHSSRKPPVEAIRAL